MQIIDSGGAIESGQNVRFMYEGIQESKYLDISDMFPPPADPSCGVTSCVSNTYVSDDPNISDLNHFEKDSCIYESESPIEVTLVDSKINLGMPVTS